MRNFILWNGTSEVQGIAADSPSKLPAPAKGQSWVEISDSVITHTCDASGATVLRPRILTIEQADKWTAAKAYRETKIASGCQTPSGMVQTDAASRARIDSLMIMAMAAGAPFSVGFTLFDNSIVQLDAAAMGALGTAVHEFLTACHASGEAIRQQIAAATDLGALDAIDITAGYPASS